MQHAKVPPKRHGRPHRDTDHRSERALKHQRQERLHKQRINELQQYR